LRLFLSFFQAISGIFRKLSENNFFPTLNQHAHSAKTFQQETPTSLQKQKQKQNKNKNKQQFLENFKIFFFVF